MFTIKLLDAMPRPVDAPEDCPCFTQEDYFSCDSFRVNRSALGPQIVMYNGPEQTPSHVDVGNIAYIMNNEGKTIDKIYGAAHVAIAG